MKNAKKSFLLLVLASILVFSLAMPVSANSPPPPEHLNVSLTNIFLIMLISIGTETAVALLFRFRGRQALTVLVVNICSQIVMRLLYLVLPFTYLVETVILEAFVYTSEFFIYKKRFNDTSTSKILWYTISANTLSLLLGILLDCYILV